jgi:flagellar hook assembly protein FlgD
VGGTRRLRITVSPDGVSSLSLSGVTAQGVTGGGVAFTYALSQPAEISADIRNISGSVVKHLGTQEVKDNSVQLMMWNGHSDRGSKVPAGYYLVRITARTSNGQTAQAIRPFDVAP